MANKRQEAKGQERGRVQICPQTDEYDRTDFCP